MAEARERSLDHSSTYRLGWLKTMYIMTTVGGGGFGLGILLAPSFMRETFVWPEGDPVAFGVTGSVYLAFGLIALLGAKRPLQFAPILALQCLYKTLWVLTVFLPLLVQGDFPTYGYLHVSIFLFFIIGDLIALPYAYLFGSPQSSAAPAEP